MSTGAAPLGLDPVVATHTSRRSATSWLASPSDLWRHRELLTALTERALKVKYQRSALGFLWTLLNPLLMVAVLIAVFSVVVRIPIPHYWAFLVSGYFIWNYLSQMLAAGSTVLTEHAALRRSVAFPTEILVFSAGAARLVEFGVAFLFAVAALALLHHGAMPSSFLMLPLLIVLLVLLGLGMTMFVSTAAVFYYDVQHALPVLLLVLFYLSPVFYPAAMVPERIQSLYLLNPIAGLISLAHIALYEGRWPGVTLLLGSTAACLVVFVGGYAIFNRFKAVFTELL
jgi:lipopolysaccharide transport system permease protein